MRMVAGTITITTSGTELPLSTHASIASAEKVLALSVKNRSTSANAFLGINGMSTTDGWTIKPEEEAPAINPRLLIGTNGVGGSVEAGKIYFDHATSGQAVDFIALLGE